MGNFPPLWSEWNGKYRDSVREFWLGDSGPLSDFAYRLMGSSDLYEATGRRPSASVNFITAHDGFTLADLTAYNEKHNEANGEDNKDGESHNRSWNCGAEGPTDDPEVNALRSHMRRNLMATQLLSQGIPMILGGDEFGRSQQGNNNAYCQDNEISWFDWDDQDTVLLEFTRHLVAFRQQHPVFHRPNFFQGRPIIGHEMSDLAWFRNDGAEMEDEDWGAGLKTVAVFLNGQAMDAFDQRGEPITDDSFLMCLNAHSTPSTSPSRLTWEMCGEGGGHLPPGAVRRGEGDDKRRRRDRCALPDDRRLPVSADPRTLECLPDPRDLPGPAHSRVRFRRCGEDSSRTLPSWASATSTARPTCRRQPAAGTATTWWTPRG